MLFTKATTLHSTRTESRELVSAGRAAIKIVALVTLSWNKYKRSFD